MNATYPDLVGKVVIVTGAARGIGKAIALQFAQQKAKLVIDDLAEKEDLLKAVKEDIEALGSDVVAVLADVRKEEDVSLLIKRAVDTFGRIDVLINNAGIVYDVDWDAKTEEEWGATLQTNLIGPYLLIRHAKEFLLASKGAVINMTSTNAYKAMNPFSLDYDASKAGLITLTHNAAKALAPHVRVNAIAPGWVDTDMNATLPKEIVEQETGKIFQERFASPNEIARVAVFLASQEAGYINGTTVTVDGGYQ